MAATDPADEISELSSKLDTIEAVVDPEAMRTEATDLREQSADPTLWEDQARAQEAGARWSLVVGGVPTVLCGLLALPILVGIDRKAARKPAQQTPSTSADASQIR